VLLKNATASADKNINIQNKKMCQRVFLQQKYGRKSRLLKNTTAFAVQSGKDQYINSFKRLSS